MGPDWAKIEEIEKEVRELKESLKDLRESKAVYSELVDDCDDQIEKWEKLKAEVEDGKEIWANQTSKKRKRQSPKANKSRKKAKKSKQQDSDDEDDFIDDGSDEDENEDEESASNSDSDAKDDEEEPLTLETVEDKLAKIKEDKKRAVSEFKLLGCLALTRISSEPNEMISMPN